MSVAPIAPKPTANPTPHAGSSAVDSPAVAGTAARADSIAPKPATAPTLRQAAQALASTALHSGEPKRQTALVQALLARVPSADRSAAKTAIPAILDAAREHGSSDPNRIAYLLATAQTESDFGANMTEGGHSKAWFNAAYGCADGNRPGTSDGYDYRGRGYVQTTRAGRYAELSQHLRLPQEAAVEHGRATLEPALVAHPDKLAEPTLAARALVVGVEDNLYTHNTAAALDRTIPIGRAPGNVDFYHARGIVNGIVRDQATAIARHATTYAQILASYGHSVLGAATTSASGPLSANRDVVNVEHRAIK